MTAERGAPARPTSPWWEKLFTSDVEVEAPRLREDDEDSRIARDFEEYEQETSGTPQSHGHVVSTLESSASFEDEGGEFFGEPCDVTDNNKWT